MSAAPETLGVARSWLFGPGDRLERLANAARSGADITTALRNTSRR
jgi:hypothetical protein